MPAPVWLSPARWPLRVWLSALGVVFLIRFPAKFALQPPFLMDFHLFHMLAQRVLAGQGAALYEAVGSAQSLFKYGPCWALLMAPVGWLAEHPAAVLWSTLNVLWLVLLCRQGMALCRFAHLTPPPWIALAAIILLVRPITAEFLLGQTNLLWALLTVTWIVTDLRGRPWPAATSLALAVSLKLPSAIFLVWLAVGRRWSLLARTLGVFALINVIAAIVLAPANPLALFSGWTHVLTVSAPDRAFEIGNQSLLALVGRLTRADRYGLNLVAWPDASVAWLVVLLEAVLCFSLIASSARHSDPAVRTFDGAILMALMVLCSPTTWDSTYSALVMPAMLAIASWRPTSLPSAIAAAVAVVLSLMTHSKFWRAIGLRHYRGESYVSLVFMILPLLALALVWMLWLARRQVLASTPRVAPHISHS